MDVWIYFEQKRREFADASLFIVEQQWAEESGTHGRRGRFVVRLMMTERAYLNVHEKVTVVGNRIRRDEYAYYLTFDGKEIWGEDRDPSLAQERQVFVLRPSFVADGEEHRRGA